MFDLENIFNNLVIDFYESLNKQKLELLQLNNNVATFSTSVNEKAFYIPKEKNGRFIARIVNDRDGSVHFKEQEICLKNLMTAK